jgi:adenylate kinase
MRTVFNFDDLPKRNLYIKKTLTNLNAREVGQEISILREQIVKEVARKCAEHDGLVTISPSGVFVEVVADIIVLTSDEFADLMRRQFRDGLEHAHQFMGMADEMRSIFVQPVSQQGDSQKGGDRG